jgi:hypothetical protein
MTLRKDAPKSPQTRTQKIVMWCVFGAAAALLIAAAIVFVVSGTPLF